MLRGRGGPVQVLDTLFDMKEVSDYLPERSCIGSDLQTSGESPAQEPWVAHDSFLPAEVVQNMLWTPNLH